MSLTGENIYNLFLKVSEELGIIQHMKSKWEMSTATQKEKYNIVADRINQQFFTPLPPRPEPEGPTVLNFTVWHKDTRKIAGNFVGLESNAWISVNAPIEEAWERREEEFEKLMACVDRQFEKYRNRREAEQKIKYLKGKEKHEGALLPEEQEQLQGYLKILDDLPDEE